MLIGFLLLAPPSASAHGKITVGDYELVIGFRNEPAYQGEPNGLDLKVTNLKTQQPVLELADTIKAEIIFGGAKRELQVKPQFGKEGYYTANMLPSEAGDYTWHIYGTIESTPLDISMTSGPGKFNGVQLKSTVSFPNAEPATADLRAASDAALQTATMAMIIGGIGLLFGSIGLFFGVRSARSRQAQPPQVARQRA